MFGSLGGNLPNKGNHKFKTEASRRIRETCILQMDERCVPGGERKASAGGQSLVCGNGATTSTLNSNNSYFLIGKNSSYKFTN